jgi:hypothetical protein
MTARTVYMLDTTSPATLPLKRLIPVILCRNEMTAHTLYTLDTTSRATLPLKTPDLCVFCAGMK